jgi:hypothetical protein
MDIWFWEAVQYDEVYASMFGTEGRVFKTREEAEADLREFLNSHPDFEPSDFDEFDPRRLAAEGASMSYFVTVKSARLA